MQDSYCNLAYESHQAVMKRCSGCKRNLSTDLFGKNRAKYDGLNAYCKECRNSYMKTWYSNNRDIHGERTKKVKKVHKTILAQFVREAKSKPCMDCGITYPYYVMDFDHRNPDEKVLTINQAQGLGWSISRIREEIDKCDLVCSNCHRIRTHERACMAQMVSAFPS